MLQHKKTNIEEAAKPVEVRFLVDPELRKQVGGL
jgi:hypothetical protein